MTSPLGPQAAAPLDLASLLNTAHNQTALSGLSKILKLLAETAGAYGCILWRGADFPSDYLFALAQSFKGGETSDLHYISRKESATGAAVSSRQVRNVDVEREILVKSSDSFFTRANIKHFCPVPIQFPAGIDGALNFYRNVDKPFNEHELEIAKQVASLVPALYQIIRDRVGLNLMARVNDLLRESERASDPPLEIDEMKKVIDRLCNLIRDTFECLEVTVFLSDKFGSPEQYDRFATTWPATEEFPRNSYKQEENSLTGWVLLNAKSVRIFDLARFEDDKEELHKIYPGLTWQDSLTIKSAFRRIFNLKPTDVLPPLSYMAAPIVRGDHVRGVIRCCVALTGPFYFGGKEVEVLQLLASQIGYYWSNWLGRRGLQQENDWWRELVAEVTNLNGLVQEALSCEPPDEERVFKETLNTTRRVLKGADINDIRLLDEKARQLRFVAFDGKEWDQGTPAEIESRKNKRFNVDENPPTSAGAYVFQTGEVHVIHDVTKAEYYSLVFHATRRKIVAPIGIKNKLYGVLDIRGTGPDEFPRHAGVIAQLIGQQLGLYHYWAEALRELRKLDREQTQAFQDVEHQLKSPVNLAYNMINSFVRQDLSRLQLLLGDADTNQKLTSRFLVVRGLSRKARRVTKNMRLFAYLARNRPIPIKPRRLNAEVLMRILIEAAKDSTRMFGPNRNISFWAEPDGFELLNTLEVSADLDLIEHAVMNLLDNAGKYSFSETIVQITAEQVRKNQFCITVANIGLPIRSNEINLVVKRAWRSEKAAWTTGEGSGIGLWIVDHIMKAHNGELVVTPTTVDHLTEVRLIFGNK